MRALRRMCGWSLGGGTGIFISGRPGKSDLREGVRELGAFIFAQDLFDEGRAQVEVEPAEGPQKN